MISAMTGSDDVSVAHTSKAFEDDLTELRALICEIGGRTEAAIRRAAEALVHHDEEAAMGVVGDDRHIDALRTEIERKAVELIALRNPLADDLRAVLAALRIAGILARMGDCAKNIARRVPELSRQFLLRQVQAVPRMERTVSAMVTGAIDAYVANDMGAALRVVAEDDAVDEYYGAIFRETVDHMTRNPQSITAGTHLLFAVQKLERIGDHAVSIARIVHFAVGGDYEALNADVSAA